MRYWLKKGKRITKKCIRYDCRQNLAKQRFRFQGRFITKAEMEQLDRDQIYDPNLKQQLPRPRRIFKVSKEHHHWCKCKDRNSSYRGAEDTETNGNAPDLLFAQVAEKLEKPRSAFPEEHQEQHDSTHSSDEIRIAEQTRL